MNEFLEKEWEFFQFLIFQGRFGGLYGVIVPHTLANKMREVLTEGGESELDYEIVIKAEKAFTDDDSVYPGAQGNSVEELVSKITKKLAVINHMEIWDSASELLNDFE